MTPGRVELPLSGQTPTAGFYDILKKNMKKILVFLDESGDHSLEKIDPDYPVFALAGVIIKPESYLTIVNRFNKLKLLYFSHEGLILHSREIADRSGDFVFLNDKRTRKHFLSNISDAVSRSNFGLVAAVILKQALKEQYLQPISPYDLGFVFLLEKIFRYSCKQSFDYIQIITESRGSKEDHELHEVFAKFKTDGSPYIEKTMLKKIHLRLEYRRKPFNIIGNQIADLVVSPIARTVLDNKDHPSFQYSEDKFLYGRKNSLKVFP